jgi:site-specific DNA-methyltransferase (adenine-specific)
MLLLNGDCIEEMQKLIDDGVQVDSVVTDPPYHLQSIVKRFGKEGSAPAQEGTDGAFSRASKGFMGKEWDGGDIAFRPETWELAMKLLKPGGHILAFSASRNYHRMAVAIEDAGFEIRDQMMWLYGSGFPKSHNIGKGVNKKLGNDTEWEGWGTALKPAHEPIAVGRKPLSESSNVNNVLKHRTGGINIDGCRIEGGRFPANVMHDGSDVIVNQFPNTKSGKLTPDMNIKPSTGWSGGSRSDRVKNTFNGDEGSAARFFYCPKTSKSERHSNLDDHETSVGANGNKWTDQDYRKGETKPTTERKNTHPTVKPVELMKYLCRLVTPKGGTVLDPFMGSGSTGMAAKDEGFDFIGIEKEEEYFKICESRIRGFSPLMDFMG